MKKIIPLIENHMFSKAYSGGATDVNKLTAVYVLRNYKKDKDGRPLPTKLGITVNKKLGGAVKRNRVKRLIRQAYRENAENLSDGKIIVISARTAIFADDVKSGRVGELLRASFDRLGIYNGQTFKGVVPFGQKPKSGQSNFHKKQKTNPQSKVPQSQKEKN